MDFQEPQGIYRQIANHLCEEILRGVWMVESRVPSVRELAVQLAVNPNTVLRAYTDLEELGVLYNRRGIGFFVDPNARSRIMESKRRDFLQRELPELFRRLELLEVPVEEIISGYRQHCQRSQPQSP